VHAVKNPRFESVVCALAVFGGLGCDGQPSQPEEVVVSESALVRGGRFGAFCQKSFEAGWQKTLNNVYDLCGWFVSQMNDTASQVFYYDLVNRAYYIEKNGDTQPPAYNSVDDVDLFWLATHGGVTSTYARWAMWNKDVEASTARMRLGDSAWWGGGLAIFVSHACDTLQHNDNLLVTRWAPVLRGGVKIVVGSHDVLNDSVTTNETGENFAYELQNGATIRNAWVYAVSDLYTAQDATIVATGTNLTDCRNRRDGMKWSNFGNYPFIRDGNIGTTCWAWWDNL
jgi:hypothetical protein